MESLGVRLSVSVSYQAAVAFAWLCRVRTLKFSEYVFRGVKVGTVIERPFYGFKIQVDVSRSSAQRLLFLEGKRFVGERHLIRALVGENARCVIDVGANIGYYMLMFERFMSGHGRIMCFEPEPSNLVELQRNVERNGLRNIEVFECAVGSRCGRVGLVRGINGRVDERGRGEIDVTLITLDSVVEGGVDLIKIDVEGYEGCVLRGARGIIERERPALFVEVHPWLLAQGYSVRGIVEFLKTYYDELEMYEVPANGTGFRAAVRRYGLGGSPVRRIADWSRLVEETIAPRTRPFWIVTRRRLLRGVR